MKNLLVMAVALSACMHAAERPAIQFESASVTRSHSGGNGYSGHVEAKPGQPIRLKFENVTLQFCIQQAYGAKEFQVSGPGWIRSARYDITAQLPAGTPSHLVWPALQALLTERFQLELRREKKNMAIHTLVVGENGPKLRQGSSGISAGLPFQPGGSMRRRSGDSVAGSLELTNASVREFCDGLSGKTNRPIVDKTGLSGTFDFKFRYYGSSASSISSALEKQLGLKLETKTGPVETLIVAGAHRPK